MRRQNALIKIPNSPFSICSGDGDAVSAFVLTQDLHVVDADQIEPLSGLISQHQNGT